eukprot:2742662-Prymnesium_polylepis.1
MAHVRCGGRRRQRACVVDLLEAHNHRVAVPSLGHGRDLPELLRERACKESKEKGEEHASALEVRRGASARGGARGGALSQCRPPSVQGRPPSLAPSGARGVWGERGAVRGRVAAAIAARTWNQYDSGRMIRTVEPRSIISGA